MSALQILVGPAMLGFGVAITLLIIHWQNKSVG